MAEARVGDTLRAGLSGNSDGYRRSDSTIAVVTGLGGGHVEVAFSACLESPPIGIPVWTYREVHGRFSAPLPADATR